MGSFRRISLLVRGKLPIHGKNFGYNISGDALSVLNNY